MQIAAIQQIDRCPRPTDHYPLTVVTSWGEVLQLSGKNPRLDVLAGTEFTVLVSENPSTGYRWNINLDNDEIQLVDDQFRLDAGILEQPPIGSGGTRELTFRVSDCAQGEVNLEMRLERPWAETTPPAARKNVHITVYPNSPVEPFGNGARDFGVA